MQSLGKFLFQQRQVASKSALLFSATQAARFSATYNYQVKARVQHPAPHFEGMSWNVDGFKKISLNDYKGKYVVLFTYPLDFTFVCPTEIIEFNDKAEDFRKNSKSTITSGAGFFVDPFQLSYFIQPYTISNLFLSRLRGHRCLH